MIVFWLIALVMTGIALALVLPAFWGHYQSSTVSFTEQNVKVARDRLVELKQLLQTQIITEQQYQQQRDELEQTLAFDLDELSQHESTTIGDKRTLYVLGLTIFIPIVAFIFYFSLGNPQVLLQASSDKSQPGQKSVQHSLSQQSMEQLIAGLEQRLQENPDNPDGWMMLGRTYMTLKRYDEAAGVFEKVISQVGEQAPVLLALADALTMSRGGRVSGRPAELVEKALQQDPNNVTGLWLAGLAEEENGNKQQAIRYWQQAEKFLVNDPQSLSELRALISRAGSESVHVEQAATPGISVRVDIADKLINKVQRDDTLFIYARAVNGSRMPLAIVRKKASELPVQVMLNDEMAMVPGMALSNFPEVNIFARISHGGLAKAQPGDLVGELKQVKTNNSSIVSITIDQILP